MAAGAGLGGDCRVLVTPSHPVTAVGGRQNLIRPARPLQASHQSAGCADCSRFLPAPAITNLGWVSRYLTKAYMAGKAEMS